MNYLLLKNVIAIALTVFVFKTPRVSGGSFGPCSGKRLDHLAKEQYMPPIECVSMGGTCCATDSVRDHINEDPTTMDASGRCFSCYNSEVNVKCQGGLIRSQPTSEAERFVTSEKCKQVGGTCCQKSPTYAFNPNYMTGTCDDCYSGNVALPCGGELIASSYYTAKTCAAFGGKCCDQSLTGGDAFNAREFPNAELLKCMYCYCGLPTETCSNPVEIDPVV